MELNEKMLTEIFNALEKGETFNYSDDNTQVSISPNSISIQLKSEIKDTSIKDTEVKEFLNFCENINDELFVETCESFDNIEELQAQLDTDNYKEVINVFTQRVKEIGKNKLNEITKAAHDEIDRQELNIKNAKAIIDDIYAELDRAQSKYLV